MRAGVIMYQTSLTKGQELVAQRMVRELRRQGHEAYLITSIYHDQREVASNEEAERQGGYLRSLDETMGIPLVRVQSRRETWPPRRITFVDFVSTLAKVVDELGLEVLITHSTLWNGPEETAKFVEWRRNQVRSGAPVRSPVFCHMSHFQEPSDERYDLPERSFREAWNSVSLPVITGLADFVLVTTPYERDQMKKMGVDEKKLVLFPGGVETTALETGGADFRRKYGVPAGPKLVTYLGTVEERKNAKAILKVARALEERQDAHFVVAGRLEGAYGQEVRVTSTGLRNVTLTGPVDDEDVPSLIRESYLNINMSKSEALGLSQLEFMYNGIPVVTSGVGGQSWIVKDGISGMVLDGPDDVEGAVKAVSRLLDDPKKREKLGAKSRETASQFTMSKLIEGLVKTISPQGGVDGPDAGAFEMGERVIEAWVKRGYRVALTTRKLMIESAKGSQAIIPLDEIKLMRSRLRFSKPVLAAGAVGSASVLLAENLGQLWGGGMTAWLTMWNPGGPVASFLVASLPLVASLGFATMRARRGYAVEYGEKEEAFVPLDFAKALRIADELTPKSLFPGDALTG